MDEKKENQKIKVLNLDEVKKFRYRDGRILNCGRAHYPELEKEEN